MTDSNRTTAAKAAIKDVSGGLEQFKTLLKLHDGLSVVHFWADWADQCGPMDEAVKVLAKDKNLAAVQFLRVEAETEADVSMEYEVAAVPTFLLFSPQGKKVLQRIEGAKVPDVVQTVKDLASRVALEKESRALKKAAEDAKQSREFDDEDTNLEDRLKRLINSSPVMLFMKGTPAAPECGFSRQTVALLQKYNAKYGSFDILLDQGVRQGLKEYSKWPTYPQLYINGELVGGLDILKELDEGGELAGMLPQPEESLKKKLERLVNKSNIMVFMKGDPSQPRCGFSRQLVDILNGAKVKYDTFDILEDEEVRQGLKEFSKWPTYPQVYVKGNLIGGLDIIRQLKDEGELEESLQG